MKSLKSLIIIFFILLSIVLFLFYALPIFRPGNSFKPEDTKGGTQMVLKNYGNDIDSAAHVFHLPSTYLKALCMLECSGKKVFQERFEPHVYDKLKMVKRKELGNYEHVTPDMLQDANEEALKNLASSWGPFQLMGYKCLLLDIKIRDIRGDQAIYYGTKWIDLTYGESLRNKDFKDAFHLHNAGSKYPSNGVPKTHDPSYCAKGLKYMQWFAHN